MDTFREIIQSLDNKRKQQTETIREIDPSLRTEIENEILNVAPITQNPIFLLSMAEEFFDAIYPALTELPKHKDVPSIHIGLAGSRNFNIMAAARSDAGILFDFNLKQQKLMEQVIHTAKSLVQERGGIEHISDIIPQDFVDAFAKNDIAAALMKEGVRKNLPTSFAPELHDRTSWLYEEQQDGRFHHMLQLFAEDKIATLAMNAIDSRGFQDLQQTLETVRNKIPELENAKVGTAFLANLAYVLDKELGYGPKGPAIKNGLFPALENLSLLGNPYFVCGKERMYDHLHSTNDIDWCDHISTKLGKGNINAPTNAQYREYRNRHPHSSEFKEITVGGYLDTLTAHFHTLREKDVKRRNRATSPYGPHSARAAEYKESNSLRR